MKNINNISPEIPLRLGLGLTLLYSGQSLLRQPEYWYGFAPRWFSSLVERFMDMDIFLRIQGSAELILGLILLLWFLPKSIVKWASILASLHVLAIILFGGIDLITFRDMGLLGASLALVLVLKERTV